MKVLHVFGIMDHGGAVGVPAKPIKSIEEYYHSLKLKMIDTVYLSPKKKKEIIFKVYSDFFKSSQSGNK